MGVRVGEDESEEECAGDSEDESEDESEHECESANGGEGNTEHKYSTFSPTFNLCVILQMKSNVDSLHEIGRILVGKTLLIKAEDFGDGDEESSSIDVSLSVKKDREELHAALEGLMAVLEKALPPSMVAQVLNTYTHTYIRTYIHM